MGSEGVGTEWLAGVSGSYSYHGKCHYHFFRSAEYVMEWFGALTGYQVGGESIETEWHSRVSHHDHQRADR